MYRTIALLILAAGQSTRMGRAKQLLPIGNQSLLAYVSKNMLALVKPENDVCAAIVGQKNDEMKYSVAHLPITWINNEQYFDGMSTSITSGVQWAIAQNVDAVIILLGDQPTIQASTVQQLINKYRETNSDIVQAQYRGISSHPVLFSYTMFESLLQLSGDVGAKQIIKQYANKVTFINLDEEVPLDLDTIQEYHDYIDKI